MSLRCRHQGKCGLQRKCGVGTKKWEFKWPQPAVWEGSGGATALRHGIFYMSTRLRVHARHKRSVHPPVLAGSSAQLSCWGVHEPAARGCTLAGATTTTEHCCPRCFMLFHDGVGVSRVTGFLPELGAPVCVGQGLPPLHITRSAPLRFEVTCRACHGARNDVTGSMVGTPAHEFVMMRGASWHTHSPAMDRCC